VRFEVLLKDLIESFHWMNIKNTMEGSDDPTITLARGPIGRCGPNGHGVILDFNPAKGDTKTSNCKFVITSYSNNIFDGPGLPNILGGPALFPGQNLRDFNTNQANNTRVANTGNGTSVVTTHDRRIIALTLDARQ
jgi:hypothetical protein